MPTGYTSKIADGISFEDFIMSCARAFGALVIMRDDPLNKTIPQEFRPSDYHKNKLVEIEKELAEVKVLSSREALTKAKKEYQALLDGKEKGIRKAGELQRKYEEMLIKVKQWNPPTSDHIGLKDFMIEQITSSIKFDCGTSCYEEQQIKLLTGSEWRAKRIQLLQKAVAYHTKEHLNEVARVAGRNDWIKKLRESLSRR